MKHLKSFLQGLAVLASLPVLLLLVVAIFAVAVPAAPFLWAHGFLRAWRFRRQHSGTICLVASRRSGWHEFISNNVVPVLPSEVQCVWQEPVSHRSGPYGVLRAIEEARLGGQKPFLIKVTAARLISIPLHEALVPFRAHGARDTAVQGQVRSILQGILAGA